MNILPLGMSPRSRAKTFTGIYFPFFRLFRKPQPNIYYLSSGFKKDVTFTNFQQVCKVLLLRENVRQTIRFLVSGAFKDSHPESTRMAQHLNAECPTLLARILPKSEQTDTDLNESNPFGVASDKAHVYATVHNRIRKDVRDGNEEMYSGPKKLAPTHPFMVLLRAAYAHDYNLIDLVRLGKMAFVWVQRLSFTDP